jgi:hypothetical protein
MNPSALRMPMRRIWELTALLTTMATMSTDMASARVPKAATKGTNAAVFPFAASSTCSQDCPPVSAPSGSVAAIAERSTVTWASLAAWVKR